MLQPLNAGQGQKLRIRSKSMASSSGEEVGIGVGRFGGLCMSLLLLKTIKDGMLSGRKLGNADAGCRKECSHFAARANASAKSGRWRLRHSA